MEYIRKVNIKLYSFLDNWHNHQPDTGVIDLYMTFKSPLTEAITVLNYQVFDKIVEVNKDMEVSMSYAK